MEKQIIVQFHKDFERSVYKDEGNYGHDITVHFVDTNKMDELGIFQN